MRSDRALFAAVTAIALALRVYALNWGLPDVHHPDEIPIFNRALAFAKGDPSPHNFLYPTLYFYTLFVWEGLFFVLGRVVGWYQSVSAFEREFFLDPSHAVLAGRALTALFGTATVVAVYRFGARLYDRPTGLVAALLLAVAPFAVRDAHYIKHDVPVTLFIVLTQAAVARLVVQPETATRRAWIGAGLLAGLALSTQYYAFPVLLTFVAAAAVGASRIGWSRSIGLLVAAGLGTVVAFAATSPFVLLEPAIAVRDMVAVRQIDLDRAVTTTGAFGSLAAYLSMIATDAVGWITAVAAVVGLVVALATDWRRGLVLACFPLAFLAFLANTVPMSRYLNPMLPSLALAAAFAITRRAATLWRPAPVSIAAILALVAATPGMIGSVRADRFYAQTDTRTLAREYVERTAVSGAGVLVQPHGVALRPSHESLVEALRAHLGSESLASIKFQKQLDAAVVATSPSYRVFYLGKVTDGGFDPEKIYVSPDAFGTGTGLQPLRARRVTYAALNRYNDGRLASGSLDAALRREARLLATFSPYRAGTGPDRRAAAAPFFHNTADRIDPALERPGPIVEVWRID